jgi:alkylated DNA repair dioxygenase AlkB
MQDLFGSDGWPEGFAYKPDLLSEEQAATLVSELQGLPFREFEFHGFRGKRRVVSFGWRYDFDGGGLKKAEDMPPFLWPVRNLAAAFANIPVTVLRHVLLTEYRPGAAIGWHKDRSVFSEVVGISLLAPCTFRLRRKCRDRWARSSVTLEPRSVYLLRGPSRAEWEHSIPAVANLRYSITFRSMAGEVRSEERP